MVTESLQRGSPCVGMIVSLEITEEKVVSVLCHINHIAITTTACRIK